MSRVMTIRTIRETLRALGCEPPGFGETHRYISYLVGDAKDMTSLVASTVTVAAVAHFHHQATTGPDDLATKLYNAYGPNPVVAGMRGDGTIYIKQFISGRLGY